MTFLSFTTSWSFRKSCTACDSTLPSSAWPRAFTSSSVSSPTRMWKTSWRIDRAGVELLGDEVRRAARDAHALLPRLLVGVRARVVRQQRRVDVDDAERDSGRSPSASGSACSARGRPGRASPRRGARAGSPRAPPCRSTATRRTGCRLRARAARGRGGSTSTATRSPFSEPGVAVADELLQAVRLLGHQHGDALALGGPPARRSVTSMPISSPMRCSPSDQLVERARSARRGRRASS